ncbi:hypothetical protein MRX96_015782 [Rhipicephalus microplus]
MKPHTLFVSTLGNDGPTAKQSTKTLVSPPSTPKPHPGSRNQNKEKRSRSRTPPSVQATTLKIPIRIRIRQEIYQQYQGELRRDPQGHLAKGS